MLRGNSDWTLLNPCLPSSVQVLDTQQFTVGPINWNRKTTFQADAELQPSSVRGGEDFTADFTFVHDHFFNNFQLN